MVGCSTACQSVHSHTINIQSCPIARNFARATANTLYGESTEIRWGAGAVTDASPPV